MVQPIKSKAKIAAMKAVLKDKDEKYYVMFMIGINSGLRISDILKLQVKDVKDKDEIELKETKTKKPKRFWIDDPLKKCLNDYITKNDMKPDDYLIPSKKGVNKPVSVTQAYRVIHAAGEAVGLDNIGTHTMRKTFGYWHYRQFHDLAMLTEIFNHSTQQITKRYIGLTQDEINNSYKEFGL